MNKVKEILLKLLSVPSPSGNEVAGASALFELGRDCFDEIRSDKTGNITLIKRCGRENASRLLIDAHFDTVGMMVTDVLDGGFLAFTAIGGLDARVLPASEVTVHGRRDVYGIIASTPPHLASRDSDSLPKISELLIDTGYEKGELAELVPIGSFVTFKTEPTELYGNNLLASGLDDKACLASIIDAVSSTPRESLCHDIYVCASVGEELGRGGPSRVAFDVKPNLAIICDVNFARGEGVGELESILCGYGAGVDISAMCDRRFTRNVIKLLEKENIVFQKICEPSHTGTNNERLLISGGGVRTLTLSIALKGMHTPSEIVSLADVKSLSTILQKIISTEREAL